MNKKALLIPMAILATLAVPGIAAAHNATATPSCGGLQWSAAQYNKDVVNTIVVKVDGATVHQDLDFKSSDDGTSPWSQTSSHTWSVVINAPGTQYDRNFGGTWQPCQTTTTVASSTTVVVTTTVPPTTSVPDVTTTVVTDPASTTTQVAVCCVVVPTTLALIDVVDVVQEPVLPRTGGATDLLMVAALLVFAGFVVMVTRRRVG